jgi:hypothetical protein
MRGALTYLVVDFSVVDLEIDRSAVVLGAMLRVMESEKLLAHYIEGNSQRIF